MTNEEAKSRTDKGMQLVLGKEVPQDIPLGLALIQSAAEADYHDAQTLLFFWYCKKDGKLAEYWFRRSEKTKPRPPGVTYTEPRSGGCAGVIVLGLALLAWAIS
jgi:TPR repeat protein